MEMMMGVLVTMMARLALERVSLVYAFSFSRRTKKSTRLVLDGWESTASHMYSTLILNVIHRTAANDISFGYSFFHVVVQKFMFYSIQDIPNPLTVPFRTRSGHTDMFESIKLNPIKKRLPPSPLMAHPMHAPPTLREKRRSFPINHGRHGIHIRMQDDIR